MNSENIFIPGEIVFSSIWFIKFLTLKERFTSENFTFAKISKNNTYNISCMLVLHMVLNQIIFNYFQ